MGLLHRKNLDMTSGPIVQQLMSFALPMAIGIIFQQLYNTVDSIVVGHFVGKEALAAVGSTASIINTLVGFSTGLATGATVVISQFFGAHDGRSLRSAVHTSLIAMAALGLVLTIAGVFAVDPLLRLMDTPEDVMPQSRTYLRIYFAGLMGMLMYNLGSGVLRAVGDSTRPLYFLCFSAVVNTLLDLLLVIAFDMGVAGVAWATLIAQALSAMLVLWVLTREKEDYGIRWNALHFDRAIFKSIFNIGMPMAIQQAITSFSNIFVQGSINYFGSACMAGYSAYSKLDAFMVVPVQAIGLASSTFVGQNYGAKNLPRARQGIKRAIQLSVAITVMLIAVMMVWARPLVSLFSTDQDVIYYGMQFLLRGAPLYLSLPFLQILSGALRGVGISKMPMVISLFSFVAFRQAYLALGRALGNSFGWVAIAYPVGWCMAVVLYVICYRRSILYKGE